MLELLIAAASLTAVDAERAFARDARRIGQWSAFRKYADDTAVMFTPQAIWAHEFLAGKKDPPKSIIWGPSHSWTSCDGRTAITRGPARPGMRRGQGRRRRFSRRSASESSRARLAPREARQRKAHGPRPRPR